MANELERIKVGELVIRKGGWHNDEMIEKVIRVTPTMFFTPTYKVWKKNGNVVGGANDSFRFWYRKATDEALQAIKENEEKKRLIGEIYSTLQQNPINILPIEKLRKIAEVLEIKIGE